ncbi:hypothetical protein DL96DRAFT_1814819 [Flagelloscypha sp. PMI_526]|nr:hypothetical protein DL96DRAFT_1814819 [Flagelloscypha sp. PMI_526]
MAAKHYSQMLVFHEGLQLRFRHSGTGGLAIERRYANELQDLAQSAASFGIEDIAVHNLVQQLSSVIQPSSYCLHLSFSIEPRWRLANHVRDIVSAFGSLVKQLPTLGAQQEEVDLLKIQEKRVSLMRGAEKERALERLNRERAKEEESLRELGSCQAQWERSEERWKEAWSELCDSLEDLDRRHLHHLANMTKSSSAALATLSQNIGEIAKSMKSASEIFSPDDVLNEFLSGAGSSSSVKHQLVTSPEVVPRPLPLSPSPSRGSTASSGSNPYHPSPIGRRSSSIRERFLDYMLFGPNNGPQPSGQRPGS